MTKIVKNNKRYSMKMIQKRSFPDLVRITIQAKIGLNNVNSNYPLSLDSLPSPKQDSFDSIDNTEPKVGRFNRFGRCYLIPRDPKRGSVTRAKYVDIVTVRLIFRGQHELRKLTLSKLGLSRMPNVLWEQNNNCLSAAAYKLLSEEGISLSELKNSIYELLNAKVEDSIKQMKSDYYMQFGRHIKAEKVNVFIKTVEISSDFEGPVNYEMTRDFTFKRQFDEVMHNHKISFFKEDSKHAVAKVGTETEEGYNTVKQITCYAEEKTILKAYLKSVDNIGSLNRIESKYSTDSLDKICLAGRQISTEPTMPVIGLFPILRRLTRIHARRVHKILAYKPLSKRPKRSGMIKKAIKNHCGSNADEIIKIYFDWNRLSTQSKTPLTSKACRTIRALVREGILFKKSRKRVATYFVDFKWLNKQYGQF